MSITAEDVNRLEGQEVYALELFKNATRKWYQLSRGGPDWREDDQREGVNVLTAQGSMKRLGAAWAAAAVDLENARRRYNADVPTTPELEPVPVSASSRHACRCYSVRNSHGELEGCIASDCPLHGVDRPRVAP